MKREKSETQMSKYTKDFKINMLLGIVPFTISTDEECVEYNMLLMKFESLAFKFGLKIIRNDSKRIAYDKKGFGTIKLIKNIFTWIPFKIEKEFDLDEDLSDTEQEVLNIIRNN